uniref:N-acetyltransferase domain-containing protein n=2 Tax=Macrostomum lignano TaxID=282301 RepID=A0A1I8HDP7_9PLAT
MSYQLSTSPLSQLFADASTKDKFGKQIREVIMQYCYRTGLLPDGADDKTIDASVASLNELDEAASSWSSLQVCSLAEVAQPQKPLLGCIIFYPTYSTWVGGRLRLGLVQCDSSQQSNQQLLYSLLRSVICRALDDEDLQRIELLHPASDAAVYGPLMQLGFEDLTQTEEWHFARLDRDGLQNLAERPAKSGIAVRAGAESDCAEVMKMIHGLASFEKLQAQVRINEDQLRRDIFGERKFAQLFIAERSNSGEILGYALAFDEFWPSGRGVCLEDVFVQPAHRGKGVCSALFSAVARDSLYNRRCHFMSLCYLAWNSAAFDVYRHYGFVDITGSDSSKSNGAHFLRLSRDQFRSALGRAL